MRAPDDGAVRGRMRSREWSRVSRGLYVREERDPLSAWQLLLPDSGAFTHLTAAAHYGLWLPPVPPDLPVFVTMGINDSRPRRPGLHVTRRVRPAPAREEDGLRWVEPHEALLACARQLGLLDLTVLVDSALHAGVCERHLLEHLARSGSAGGPMLRRALAKADPRSESPWETLLRMLHVACDVPVRAQHEVTEDGVFVARGDLWIVGTRSLHEYDGSDHLLRPQQRKDLRRGRRITNTEWIRRGYTSDDLLFRGIGILRDADLSLQRPHEPRRIRAWHRLLADSLFTPAGTAYFRSKLGLAGSADQDWSVATRKAR